jgi:hypothetical protein
MEIPSFDPYPKDYADEVVVKSIGHITQKSRKIQEILEYNLEVKKMFRDKVAVRNLAIASHFYDLKYGYGHRPSIRLNGRWLENWGFTIGDRVSVITLPRLLILTPQEVSRTVPLTTGLPPKQYRL